MNILRAYKKNDEEGGLSNPFSQLEKSAVLQEARVFNSSAINAKKCAPVLTKVLLLISQGTPLNPTEATETFFAITKLFQSNDLVLRRLVYLSIKEMSKIANDVIIVTQSLTKDMTGKEDQYRASAIRALCMITDGSMIQAIERYMKQALVDKNPAVSSAALVSAWHLCFKGSGEIVKRWVNEVQEATSSDSMMVQYHALGLLYHLRKHDRLAVSKMVTKQIKSSLRSPFAYCFLIQVACRVLEDEERNQSTMLYDFLDTCLRHKSEMVVYEAARAMVNLKNVTAKEVQPAVSVLQMFLTSTKPTIRFAAVKTLNRVAMLHPDVVTSCNSDLENLISDSNRSIATLAITTLLKTGSETSVERLMKQINTFMSEISDEFKTVVVEAIQSVCVKFPRKHHTLMGFLSGMLREEGGFEYKKAIVNTIITMIEENPEAKESGLSHLCEFIEDCEYVELATRILHLLGMEGPRTPKPYKYIRFIYNRVLLESPPVRAAAVTSLAKFGASCDDLLPSIIVLLDRCLMDSDDEVRDRALLYLEVLKQKQRALSSAYILNPLSVSIAGLERALVQYCSQPQDDPFDIKTVPIEATPITAMTVAPKSVGEPTPGASVQKTGSAVSSTQEIYAGQLAAIPQFARLGPLFKSSEKPVELTETETEYVVRCVKHVFPKHVVFQFDVTNTLNDQLLENVRVEMEAPDNFAFATHVPIPRLPYGQPGTTYTLVAMENTNAVSGTFLNTLKFLVKDCDPTTGEPDSEDGGFDDEYVLENVDLVVADHVQRVLKPNFAASWDEVGEENQVEETFVLTAMKDVPDAVKQITGFMGMQPCERSDKVEEGGTSHTLLLAGVFRGGVDVLVKARLARAQGVTMKMAVRSTDMHACEVIASAVG